jgi:hypothetical protein
MAISQTGPLTKDPAFLAIGMYQVRVAKGSTETLALVSRTDGCLSGEASMGALASTKIALEKEYFTHESGFPLMEDAQLPIREKAMLEFAFEEIEGRNMVIAAGGDPAADGSGEIKLGAMSQPTYMRVEAWYTYSDKARRMIIVFPRAQIVSNLELENQKEEAANAPVTVRATRADSGITGGHANWDAMPLGRIYWEPVV